MAVTTLKPTRNIQQRWYVHGTLELLTPTHLSNGDDDPVIDLPIVTDPLEGRALLTGASLAGALRSYLGCFSYAPQAARKPAVVLFGAERQDNDGEQSNLIVDDALGIQPRIELRDGVAIDPRTRTARDGQKYDRQLLAAGTTFHVGFELPLSAKSVSAEMLSAFATALAGLQEGHIRLGGRKRRGYGRCTVRDWVVWQYDLTTGDGLACWLAHGYGGDQWPRQGAWRGQDIRQHPAFAALDPLYNNHSAFSLNATLAIDGSLLIRSGFELDQAPDVSHLASWRNGQWQPVLTGTSLAGVLRHQGLRIAATVSGDDAKAQSFVDHLFGCAPQTGSMVASRVTVAETVIEDAVELVQSRVAIDRFTGGALEAALFTEQPVFGGKVPIQLELFQPTEAEIGLLLLLFKDLWTGQTAVGGEASVGRGRLKGLAATLRYQRPGGNDLCWQLMAEVNNTDHIQWSGDNPAWLEQFVQAFCQEMEARHDG